VSHHGLLSDEKLPLEIGALPDNLTLCLYPGRRTRHPSSLVVEVSRHRYGGRLVSVHTNVQLVNSSGLTLQLGYLSPVGLSAQPVEQAELAPGDSMWLPLQVGGHLQVTLHEVMLSVVRQKDSVLFLKSCSPPC